VKAFTLIKRTIGLVGAMLLAAGFYHITFNDKASIDTHTARIAAPATLHPRDAQRTQSRRMRIGTQPVLSRL